MILRKLMYLVITVFGVLTITFFMLKLAPGDPAQLALGPRATKEAIQAFRESKGLDKPAIVQYFYYIKDVATLNLGKSIRSDLPVVDELKERLPATIELAFTAIILATILGIIAGVFSAVYRNTLIDYITMTVSLIGVSIPIFWLGLIFIIIFSINLNLLPTGGRIDPLLFIKPITNFYFIDSLIYLFKEGDASYLISTINHLFLPAITLATIPLSIISRITKASMLDVLKSEYIETAVSYGIKKNRIIFFYALKNALLPIITVIGLQFGGLLSGAILTETIYSWPGIGTWIYQAIITRDSPIIQAGVLVIAIVFVSINFLIDILYVKINPKITIED